MEKEPDNYLAVKGSAIIAFKTGNFDKAIESFKHIIKEDKTDYACSYYIAKSYENLGNDILTKEYYKNAIKDFPTFINSYIDFSKYLISQKEYAEAQRKLRKAVKIEENNTEILNLLFYVSYILVKDSICEYNVKEVLSIADKINEIDPETFKYPEEKAELTEILNKL